MDLQSNASKVVELTSKIKKLTDQLKAHKEELLEQMLAENIQQIQIKRQNVSLCQRKNKDFGPEINRRQLELKADISRLETLGEFTISSVTNFIQVRWHLGRHNRLPILSTLPPFDHANYTSESGDCWCNRFQNY